MSQHRRPTTKHASAPKLISTDNILTESIQSMLDVKIECNYILTYQFFNKVLVSYIWLVMQSAIS